MKKAIVLSTIACLFISDASFADTFAEGTANEFEIEFVEIFSATNPTSGYGIVNNDYRMGTYEITNDQWNKFKNDYGAVSGNPSGAYNSTPIGNGAGINMPTNMVSWYEAAQFVNWLNTSNGYQAAYNFTGTQGQSDYTFNVWDVTQTDGTNLYRHKDTHYFLPTEDEWVKAAYWNGANLQTYSNASAADLISGSPDPAKWNYNPLASNLYDVSIVGSGIEELNGTYDMMGNVWEWTESPYIPGHYTPSSDRGVRGGSCMTPDFSLSSSYRNPYGQADHEDMTRGFRVASVPEPTTLVLLGMGGVLIRKRSSPSKRSMVRC